MTNLSFSTAILLVIVSHSFFHNSVTTAHASISHNNRETLEIVIGGGYISPAEPPDCPPPPPPPCPPPPPPPLPPTPSPPPTPKQSPTPKPPKQSSPPPPKPLPPSHPPDISATLSDGRVLKNFGGTVGDDPKHIIKTWKGDDPCKFKGVICGKFKNKRRVLGIDLNGGRLNGKKGKPLDLNDIVDKIPNLMFFHANSNNFTNVHATNISKLAYIFELDLSNNKLAGPFPEDVLKTSTLSFLDLRFNYLVGTLPRDAFKLYLDVLFLNNNQFSGNIPDNLGDVRALYLTLANNFFTGQIPSSIGKCRETLVEVLFLNNSLSGCLPYEIGKLNNLRVFDASNNQLTGPIPHSFGCLEEMQLLNLSQNHLYGPVPEMVCKLGNLYRLTLNDNYFTQVGPECRKLMSKNMLDMRMNCVLGLPNQRTPAQCAAFFSRHRPCPDERSLQIIPCSIGTAETSLDGVPRPAMAPSPSYAALEIHH